MPDESTDNDKELISNKGLVLMFLVLLAPMILLFFVWGKNPAIQKRLATLRQIAAETPVYPDFKEIATSSIMKEKHGVFSVFYDVPAYSFGFDTVKKFYTETLTSKGWSFVEENTYGWNTVWVKFRKGEYSISIEHSEGGREGWDYAISYGWRSP